MRELWAQARRAVETSSPGQRALRALLAATALAAFLVQPDRGASLAGVAAWMILLATPFAVTMPASDAPLGVLLAALVSWLAGWGGQLPPVAGTVLLGAALYLHHVTATLAGAVPTEATLERTLLRRWSVPLAAGAVGLLGTALLAYRTSELPLSPLVQVAGLVGVLLSTATLVLLARR